jgi:hypothetical protein
MATITRRKLLRQGAQAMAVGGGAAYAGPAMPALAASRAKVKAVDYHQKLGVTPLINAAGTYTGRLESTSG